MIQVAAFVIAGIEEAEEEGESELNVELEDR